MAKQPRNKLGQFASTSGGGSGGKGTVKSAQAQAAMTKPTSRSSSASMSDHKAFASARIAKPTPRASWAALNNLKNSFLPSWKGANPITGAPARTHQQIRALRKEAIAVLRASTHKKVGSGK